MMIPPTKEEIALVNRLRITEDRAEIERIQNRLSEIAQEKKKTIKGYCFDA